MSNNYINFKRKRDLGTTISDTFAFLRNEYKSIFKLYFRHVGRNITAFSELLPSFGIGLFAMIIFSILYYAFTISTISGLIKSYIDNQGVINEEEVRNTVNHNYLKMSGVVILIWLILMVGFMACFLPGIYLMVPFSLVVYVMIFQNKGFGDAVSESFKLIKDNWWISFATLIVIAILVSLINSVFQIPAMILTGIESFTAIESNDPSMFNETGSRILYLVFSVIANLAQNILGLISVIAVSFIYFNLNEIHNNTGTLEDIDQIGND